MSTSGSRTDVLSTGTTQVLNDHGTWRLVKNTNSILHLLFGIGQGATNGLLRWTFHTNMLTQIYNKQAGGCTMQNPIRSIILK
eukprot:6723282-Ditylum_brightwellii.AAC.1